MPLIGPENDEKPKKKRPVSRPNTKIKNTTLALREAEEKMRADGKEHLIIKDEEILDKNPVGSPSKYTWEMAQRICELTKTSRHGYRRLAKENPGLPTFSCFIKWRNEHPEFEDLYRNAKISQAIYCTENFTEEAENALLFYNDKDGSKKVDGASVAYAKLISDNRRWLATKLAPRVYGDAKRIEDLEGQNDNLRAELAALRMKLDKTNASEY